MGQEQMAGRSSSSWGCWGKQQREGLQVLQQQQGLGVRTVHFLS
jgi:hypothetical protein